MYANFYFLIKFLKSINININFDEQLFLKVNELISTKIENQIEMLIAKQNKYDKTTQSNFKLNECLDNTIDEQIFNMLNTCFITNSNNLYSYDVCPIKTDEQLSNIFDYKIYTLVINILKSMNTDNLFWISIDKIINIFVNDMIKTNVFSFNYFKTETNLAIGDIRKIHFIKNEKNKNLENSNDLPFICQNKKIPPKTDINQILEDILDLEEIERNKSLDLSNINLNSNFTV